MLTLISGRIGDGKTKAVADRIKNVISQGREAVLIVPDQNTFDAERMLCTLFGGGFSAVRVLSFNRLCDVILKSAMVKQGTLLTDSGRAMLLRLAIDGCRDQLTVFGKSSDGNGFSQRIIRMIALLKSCGITPEGLETMYRDYPDGYLKRKLMDTAVIYNRYNLLLGAGYQDNNDRLSAAAKAVDCPFLYGKEIFIDGFDVLTVKMTELIIAMLKVCDVTVTVSMCGKGRDEMLYIGGKQMYNGLCTAAELAGEQYQTVVLPVRARRQPDIAALCANLFATVPKAYSGACNAVELYCAGSISGEIRHAAAYIIQKLKDRELNSVKEVRQRDFAVVCLQPELYLPLISRLFAQRGLTVFCDTRRPMLAQPLPLFLLNAIRAALSDNDSEPYLEYLASVLCPMPRDDAERLAEFITCYGVSASQLRPPYSGRVLKIADIAAQLEPIDNLRSNLLKCNGVKAFLQAVNGFIKEIKLDEAQQMLIDRCIESEMVTEADEYNGVWNGLCELFSQMLLLAGDADITAKKALELLENGMQNTECGVLPSSIDCVRLCDTARSKLPDVDYVIVLGANYGVFPAPQTGEGLLSAQELNSINRNGKVLAPDSEDEMRQERFGIANLMFKPGKGLLISYAAYTDNGKQLRPAMLVKRIQNVLPELVLQRATSQSESAECLNSPEDARHLIYSRLLAGQELTEEEKAAMAYYDSFGGFELFRAALDDKPETRISDTLSKTIYPNHVNITQLEKEATCPLMHFYVFGLGAKKTEEFTQDSRTTGIIMHGALEKAMPVLMELKPFVKEKAFEIVNGCVMEKAGDVYDGVALATERGRLNMYALSCCITDACERLINGMGNYEPKAYELRINTDTIADSPYKPEGVEISGTIDRVDISTDGRNSVRVVDYKSSSHTVTADNVEKGVSLQLPIYLAAAKEYFNAEPAEMLYFNVFEKHAGKEACVIRVDDKFTQEDMNRLLASAGKTAKLLADRISSGYINATPGNDACRYCDYAKACRYCRLTADTKEEDDE